MNNTPFDSQLPQNSISLLTAPRANYDEMIFKILKQCNLSLVCYVTLNKASSYLLEELKKHNLNKDNFYFIDGISAMLRDVKEEKNCLFISSPNDLVELSIAINEIFSSKKFEALIFDSLSNLLVYHKNNQQGLSNFFSSLSNLIKRQKMRALFICFKNDEKFPFINENAHFIDKYINMQG